MKACILVLGLMATALTACATAGTPTSSPSSSSLPPISISPPPTGIELPNVIGEKLKAAKQELTALGLRVQVKYKVSSKKEGTVLRQSPESSASVEDGDRITLTVAKEKPAASPSPVETQNCTPGYSPCLPPASDYDCAGGSGDGPEYVYGTVQVTGSDPYRLDTDGDGVGCE